MQIFLVREFRSLVSPLDAVLLAVENGEGRTEETLRLLTAMGVLSDWPDLALVMSGSRVHWIEVKLGSTLQHARTDLRDGQREMHDLLAFYDHHVSVVRSPDEFWAIVDNHGIYHAPPRRQHEQLLLPRPRRRPKKA